VAEAEAVVAPITATQEVLAQQSEGQAAALEGRQERQ
jgi:hypothetical protein